MALAVAHERDGHRVDLRVLRLGIRLRLLSRSLLQALASLPNGLARDRTNLIRQMVRQAAVVATYEALAQRLRISSGAKVSASTGTSLPCWSLADDGVSLNLPRKLRTADLTRFAVHSHPQLELAALEQPEIGRPEARDRIHR